MLIAGLTGSIAMGKSTVAGMLRGHGIPVFDADAEVHRFYAAEGAPLIEAAFPGTTANGKVDRARLAAVLGRDGDAFRRLEAIVHPQVRSAERRFLTAEHARGTALAVLEIPLLYETGADRLVDVVVVVSAPVEQQRERLAQRPGMTPARRDALLARQTPDGEKRRRADFVVDTGGSLAETRRQVDTIVASLATRSGKAFARHWS